MPDNQKRACLIYVPVTAGRVVRVREALMTQGYSVCEVEATSEGAPDGAGGVGDVPQAVLDCMANAELCLFLLPENPADDGCLAAAGSAADAAERRIIAGYVGERAAYPQVFDDNAESILKVDGQQLEEAIGGQPIWEKPDGTRATDREIIRVRCQ